MSRYERKGWFTVDLPPGWVGEEDEDIVVLHHPDRSGAMHVSAQTLEHRKPGGRIDVMLALRGYLRGLGVKMKEKQADRWTRDVFEFACHEYVSQERGEGPTFWRTWFVTNQDVLAMLTYNCPEKDKDVERDEVDAVLRSLKLTSAK
jgi:hypothetical protein